MDVIFETTYLINTYKFKSIIKGLKLIVNGFENFIIQER